MRCPRRVLRGVCHLLLLDKIDRHIRASLLPRFMFGHGVIMAFARDVPQCDDVVAQLSWTVGSLPASEAVPALDELRRALLTRCPEVYLEVYSAPGAASRMVSTRQPVVDAIDRSCARISQNDDDDDA